MKLLKWALRKVDEFWNPHLQDWECTRCGYTKTGITMFGCGRFTNRCQVAPLRQRSPFRRYLLDRWGILL